MSVFENMNPLLTVKDLAPVLNVHPKTCYKWTREGKVPVVYINGRPRFRQSDIDEFIEKGKVKSPFQDSPGFPGPELSLDSYDRMHLKGGCSTVNKKRRCWNYGTGSVYIRETKQGKERWYLDYRNSRGERIQEVVKTAQSRAEAVIALQGKIREIFNSQCNPMAQKKHTRFKDFAEVYLRDYAQVKKRGWKKADRSYLAAHLIPAFGDIELSMITSHHVEQYMAARIQDQVQKSTINRELACLRKMLNKAIDWEYLTLNPAAKIRPFPEKANLKERVLAPEEETRLMEVVSGSLRPILIVALNTGMRRGEILTLTWNEVSFSRGEIRVENTKSGKARTIPMNRILGAELQRLRRENGNTAYVFANPSTHKPFWDLRRSFIRACKEAGITGIRFHDLRHTFASRLVQAGKDIVTVKELLGHSSLQVTMRYTHSNMDLKRRAVEALTTEHEEKQENLLHVRDMERQDKPSVTVTSLSTVH